MVSIAWWVYIVRCADGSLYTGIATDTERRVTEHNRGDRLAARYTRGRRPVVLVYRERCDSRGEASRREHVIKRLGRPAKLALVENDSL